MNRHVSLNRRTEETEVQLELDPDRYQPPECHTGIGFFDHMLHLMAYHGRLKLKIKATGDLETDDHHLVEDVAIVLGRALSQALGERRGICRYGSMTLPMDEVLVTVAVDLSGRFAFVSNYQAQRDKVGGLSTEMVNHFFQTLAAEAHLGLHLHLLHPGDNEHHRVEALFKGFGRALAQACRLTEQGADEIPSSKGVLG